MRLVCHVVTSTIALLVLAAFSAPSARAVPCERLEGKKLGVGFVMAATSINPPFTVMGKDPPRPTTVSAPFCRIEGVITPTTDSDIRFELWLPPASAWNGKYQGVGNGGFAGSLIYPAMNWALETGYAVSGTDTGHTGSAIDSRWALGHPAKIADFGWRAIHVTAITSKAIIQAYYGRAAAHAYFTGCSDGGREALMEAQRFPDDYDGIVAGAPANTWTRLLPTLVWDEQALVAEPGSGLPASKLPAITDAVLAACHGNDGYLDNPSRCEFDPAVLRCKATDSDTCLTDAQVDTVRKIYSGPHDAAGHSVFPGFEPGSEAGPTGWKRWITGNNGTGDGSLQLAFARGYFSDFVFGKPDWDFRTMNFDSDIALTDHRTGEALNANETDLTKFKANGGKLIQYHGWHDSAIPARSSIDYYQAVANKMGGVEATQSFYRLFMAPGMQHCGMGEGPNAVGGVFGLPSPSRDASHDVVAALAHWVEAGVAPPQIVATRYNDNDPAKGIEAQRPWCPYPAAAQHTGQGSRSEAANFTCTTAAKP
jgi:hypothetical protein